MQPHWERDEDFLHHQSLKMKVGEVHGHRKVDPDQDLVAIGQDQDLVATVQDLDALDQDRWEDLELGHQITDPDHQVQPLERKPKVGMLTMRNQKSVSTNIFEYKVNIGKCFANIQYFCLPTTCTIEEWTLGQTKKYVCLLYSSPSPPPQKKKKLNC